MDYDVEGCYMHGKSKIFASAVGDLLKTKNKVPQNPTSPEMASLMKKNRAIAAHPRYENRVHSLLKACDIAHTRRATPDLDVNKTRVAAAHGMLLGNLKMSPAWPIYCHLVPDAASLQMTEEEWVATAELEAV